MAQWIFDANDVEDREFDVIPEGNHRVRIFDVTEKTSSTNKTMYEIVLEVSGYASRIWDYLVFDNSDEAARKRTNNKISSIAASFGVQPQTVVNNPSGLKGKVGGCRVKHSTYKGEKKANVSFYLSADKTAALPDWKNAGSGVNSDIEVIDDGGDDVEF